METNGNCRVLVVTIGAGDPKNLEASLVAPVRLSVGTGHWDRVVLTPSRSTIDRAERIQQTLSEMPIEIHPLEKPGDEDDACRCLESFMGLFQKLLAEGATPDGIVVDFTRGTKVMTVFVVLAASRCRITRFRYVKPSQRTDAGVVLAGNESVVDVVCGC